MCQVLLVEDDPSGREVIGELLREEGYVVVEVPDGQKGLLQLGCHLPDVVLLDLLMPVMGGIEMLHAMRSDPRLRHIPVLGMTASPRKADALLRAGAQGCLHKPFGVEEILQALRRVCSAEAA